MSTRADDPVIEVRRSTPADQTRCEELTRDAFWNVYAPGATEHLFWHTAHRGHPDLVTELSLVATTGADGAGATIVGCVMCTRGRVGDQPHDEGAADEENGREAAGGEGTRSADDSDQGVLLLGPIAVDPAHQGAGIGTRLLEETVRRAAEQGFAGIILYGNPAFYTDRGFVPAGRFGLTTPTGETPPVFLGVELRPGALDGVTGPVRESPLFSTDPEDVDAFDARFPAREKQVLPGQL